MHPACGIASENFETHLLCIVTAYSNLSTQNKAENWIVMEVEYSLGEMFLSDPVLRICTALARLELVHTYKKKHTAWDIKKASFKPGWQTF